MNGSFVVGFDGDRPDTFATLAQWIEAHRLACATFHILTPYPGTPLFRQLDAEGRLLHRDWELYDTAHVVSRPKHLTPDELLLGYDWLYRRLFSHASIWARQPEARSASRPPTSPAHISTSTPTGSGGSSSSIAWSTRPGARSSSAPAGIERARGDLPGSSWQPLPRAAGLR